MLTIEQIKNLTKEDITNLSDLANFNQALNIQELRDAYAVVNKLQSKILPIAEALSQRAEDVGLNPTSSWDDMEDEDGNEVDEETQNIRGSLYDNFENLADLVGQVYGDTYDSYEDMTHQYWTPSTC